MNELERSTWTSVNVGISIFTKKIMPKQRVVASSRRLNFISLSDMDLHCILPPSLPLVVLQVLPDLMPPAPVSVLQAVAPASISPAQIAAQFIVTPEEPLMSPPTPPSLSSTSSTQFFRPPLPTHADRNTLRFVQPSRQLAKSSDAQKASLKIRQDANEAEQKTMNTELSALLSKHRLELTELAGRHGKKFEYIEKLISSSKHYKAKRVVNIENAKLHAKATEINAGQLSYLCFFILISCSFPTDRSVGDRVKLPELRQMVKEDPAFQDLSKEQEDELREEVMALREQKKLGARPTNHAASQDYRHQLEALNDQVRFYLHVLFMTSVLILIL